MENTTTLKAEDIEYIIHAHNSFPSKPSKAFRKFDGRTPSFYHPLWCATTFSSETSLSQSMRERGTRVLLYHDVPEDTTLPLPPWITSQERQDIDDMTFEGFEHETREIWKKPSHIQLFKVYDKTHNLMDGSWMSQEKRRLYENYAGKLCKNVEKEYSGLKIFSILREVIHHDLLAV